MNHTNLHPMRRPDRAASEDFARRTANEAPYGTLVTASASGEPYGTPVSPVIEDDKIYFHAAAGAGRKFENLTANPRCSMVFVSMTEPDEPAFSMNYRSAVFEGRATLVTDEIEKMHALWLIGARWAGSQPIAKRRAYIEGDMARCDVWRIDVNVISGKTREMRRCTAPCLRTSGTPRPPRSARECPSSGEES